MTITTNATIDFFGTQDTVTASGGTSSVANDAFSVAADGVSGGWTNDDDAKKASAVLTFQYASGTITRNGVRLYARLLAVDSTIDESIPDANYKEHYLGTFFTDAGMATSTNVAHALEIELPNTKTSQVYEFYIENKCGVTLSAGWTIKVTPKADGPHA